MKLMESMSRTIWLFICWLVFGLCLVPASTVLGKNNEVLYLVVAKVEKEQNRVVARLPLTLLTKRRLITVTGPLGKTTIEIEGARARVIDSPCRDKVCVHFGWLSKKDDFSACLPNKVLVTIEAAPAN